MNYTETNSEHLEVLAQAAAQCHAAVNQTYGGYLPYEFHLRLTASYAARFLHLLPLNAEEAETLFAAAYFHDSLEDARLTYNDLTRLLTRLKQEHGLLVNVQEVLGISETTAESEARTFMPAHLPCAFDFGSNTWDAADEAGLTFDEMDAKNYTWAQIDSL